VKTHNGFGLRFVDEPEVNHKRLNRDRRCVLAFDPCSGFKPIHPHVIGISVGPTDLSLRAFRYAPDRFGNLPEKGNCTWI